MINYNNYGIKQILISLLDSSYDDVIPEIVSNYASYSNEPDDEYVLAKSELESTLADLPGINLEEWCQDNFGWVIQGTPDLMTRFDKPHQFRAFLEILYFDIFSSSKDFKSDLLVLVDPKSGLPSSD